MSDYEGLNLVELLALLHPPLLPDPVSLIPGTGGWWVVGAWLGTLAGVGVWQWRRYRRAGAYRREALQLLTDGVDAPTLARLLKRTALAAYERERVAHLSGRDWAEFLVETSGADPQVRAAAPALASAAYEPHADVAELLAPARRWIRVHRA